MTIRPQDLRDQRFRVTFRGAARTEVRELLGAVAEDYEATLAEIERLRADLASAGTRLVTARDQDREATQLLSRAEADAQALRAAAEREASDASARAEARMAAMLRELAAERKLLADRIEECVDREHRLTALLQGQLDDAARFLATEPVLETAAPEPGDAAAVDRSPVASAESKEAIASAASAVEESPWSAADVSSALAAATGQPAGVADVEEAATHWASFDPATALDSQTSHGRAAAATTQGGEAARDGRSLRPASWLSRGRLIPAGLAGAVIVIALASPGSSPAPENPTRKPQRVAVSGAPARAAHPAPLAGQPSGPAPRPTEPPRVADAPSAVPAGTLRVTIEAIRPCWLRLTANGRAIERELKAGETLTRDSTSDVIIRAGNAGALVVSLNGRTLPPLGREGEIVTRRLTIALAAQ